MSSAEDSSQALPSDGVYRRPRHEYLRPQRSLDLGALPDQGFFNIAGTDFYEERIVALSDNSLKVELVPEPGNPWDKTAVSVEHGGTRLGYMPSKLASSYFPLIVTFNSLGFAVFTNARITDGNEWSSNRLTVEVRFSGLSLVTLLRMWSGTFEVARAVFATLPLDDDGKYSLFNLWSDLETTVLERAHEIADAVDIHSDSVVSIQSSCNSRSFLDYPFPHRSVFRLIQKTERIRRIRLKRIRRALNVELASRMVSEGMTRVAIGKVLDVSSGTVTRYLSERTGQTSEPVDDELEYAVPTGEWAGAYETALASAIEAAVPLDRVWPVRIVEAKHCSGGVMSYYECCVLARLLVDAGLTPALIADLLKIDVDSIGALVADAYFYDDPSSDRARNLAIEQFRESGASIAYRPRSAEEADAITPQVFHDHLSLLIRNYYKGTLGLQSLRSKAERAIQAAVADRRLNSVTPDTLSLDEKDSILALADQLWTPSEIGDECQLPEAVVRIVISDSGKRVWTLNDRSALERAYRCFDALNLKRSGFTYAEIASHLKVGRSSVKGLLRDGRRYEELADGGESSVNLSGRSAAVLYGLRRQ
ncbi:HIRAN domain-containing protein [Brevibacterium sp. 'Marine']|uniref:HIRAN domain-containing protein n=1 Tax=Brevibacterium sp. 'Marine' TaxID=2725563 RepID=UPI00145F08F1|nr:HIRAN domain-containing protein [Brevibacterium sp. 'Marine']